MLPLFVLLLSAALFFGKTLWHYTVLQRAAQDAAIFLARVSIEDIRAVNMGFEVPIAGVARSIALAEISELLPGDNRPTISILCNGAFCGGNSTPSVITVIVDANIVDPLFASFLGDYGLGNDILLTARASTDFIDR